jgi:hypothetical protein
MTATMSDPRIDLLAGVCLNSGSQLGWNALTEFLIAAPEVLRHESNIYSILCFLIAAATGVHPTRALLSNPIIAVNSES